jgi:hypothetical protein
MATFRARVVQEGGAWVASAIALPNCWSRAASRQQALAKLRDEIRYRIEYCPCTGVEDTFVQVEPVDEVGGRDVAPRRATTPAITAPAAASARPPAELSGAAGCPGPRQAASRAVPAAPSGGAGAAPTGGAASAARRVAATGSGWKRWDD